MRHSDGMEKVGRVCRGRIWGSGVERGVEIGQRDMYLYGAFIFADGPSSIIVRRMT